MNLENLNVAELSAQEVQEVEGGGIFGIIILVAFIAGAWLSQKNMPDRTNVDFTPGPYYPSGSSSSSITMEQIY